MQKIINLVKKYPYITSISVLAIVVILVLVFSGNGSGEETGEVKESNRTVNTMAVSEFASGAVGYFAPTAAGNSFVVRAESSGRVNDVAESGTSVEKGDILANLENSAQLASLTQAQGAYESAVANAEQSSFNVDSSQESLASSYNSANNTLRSTGITVRGIMENTVNTYFRDNLRQSLNLDDYFWEKKLLDYEMDDWNERTRTSIPNEQIVTELDKVIAVTQRVSDLLNVLFESVLDEENGATDSERAVLATYKTDLTSAKSTIATTLQTLQSTKLDVTDTEAALSRAEASSLGGNTSAEEARIKQTLGSLQAAQSAYEKTIVRAPFAGTIVSLNVTIGDIINTGTDIAIIAPEDNADTEQSFNLPLSAVKYTPTGAYVFSTDADGVLSTIEVQTGLVTTNSIQVTGLTGSEVIVEDVRGLKAGETVNIK